MYVVKTCLRTSRPIFLVTDRNNFIHKNAEQSRMWVSYSVRDAPTKYSGTILHLQQFLGFSLKSKETLWNVNKFHNHWPPVVLNIYIWNADIILLMTKTDKVALCIKLFFFFPFFIVMCSNEHLLFNIVQRVFVWVARIVQSLSGEMLLESSLPLHIVHTRSNIPLSPRRCWSSLTVVTTVASASSATNGNDITL